MQLFLFHLFFPPNWGDRILLGQERKNLGSTNFPSFLTLQQNTCKHKISQLQKIKQLKRIWFANINLYWWIMSTIFISILLQKNTVWFYLLWIWLEQEIFLTLVGRWIEWSSQQISSIELIRNLLFFKSSNVKARRLKFFGALEAWSIEFQRFGFVEVYESFLA